MENLVFCMPYLAVAVWLTIAFIVGTVVLSGTKDIVRAVWKRECLRVSTKLSHLKTVKRDVFGCIFKHIPIFSPSVNSIIN